MENNVVLNLLEHYRTQNIIDCNQHGFIPNRSCVTMLAHVLDEWAFNLAKYFSNQIDIINLDCASNYDKVPRHKIISTWPYKIQSELVKVILGR